MPETDLVKRIRKWKPFTGRSAGRLKCQWEVDVRNDLKKWAEQVKENLKWKDTVERDKNVSEL